LEYQGHGIGALSQGQVCLLLLERLFELFKLLAVELAQPPIQISQDFQ
jgi:hypothetical protein